MDLSEFYYSLPGSLIAQKPARQRDDCRLMILEDERIAHKRFCDVLEYLNEGDVLLMNSTRVLAHRLVGKKDSGSPAEVILTKELDHKKNIWECHVKTRNPHPGMKILFDDGDAMITGQDSVDKFLIRLGNRKILASGSLPKPPYIKRDLTDKEYQTVYSKNNNNTGSVAAPTAGLHFTKRLLQKIQSKGVQVVFIELHVGFGTFLPIMDNISSHKTEEEYFEISNSAARAINERKGRLIVVGTTTLKALESSSRNGKIFPSKKSSGIFIYPGHEFSSGADALITNFHLPKSSLILLTCAFGGRERIMDAYHQAIKRRYRFYSLGDAMLIFKG